MTISYFIHCPKVNLNYFLTLSWQPDLILQQYLFSNNKTDSWCVAHKCWFFVILKQRDTSSFILWEKLLSKYLIPHPCLAVTLVSHQTLKKLNLSKLSLLSYWHLLKKKGGGVSYLNLFSSVTMYSWDLSDLIHHVSS
jgi:hypothetical protein